MSFNRDVGLLSELAAVMMRHSAGHGAVSAAAAGTLTYSVSVGATHSITHTAARQAVQRPVPCST